MNKLKRTVSTLLSIFLLTPVLVITGVSGINNVYADNTLVCDYNKPVITEEAQYVTCITIEELSYSYSTYCPPGSLPAGFNSSTVKKENIEIYETLNGVERLLKSTEISFTATRVSPDGYSLTDSRSYTLPIVIELSPTEDISKLRIHCTDTDLESSYTKFSMKATINKSPKFITNSYVQSNGNLTRPCAYIVFV